MKLKQTLLIFLNKHGFYRPKNGLSWKWTKYLEKHHTISETYHFSDSAGRPLRTKNKRSGVYKSFFDGVPVDTSKMGVIAHGEDIATQLRNKNVGKTIVDVAYNYFGESFCVRLNDGSEIIVDPRQST